MTGASAVVRTASKEIGPTWVSTVPHSDAFGKREAIAARIRYEVVVLPFVPVTAMVVRRVAGDAYTLAHSAGTTARGSAT